MKSSQYREIYYYYYLLLLLLIIGNIPETLNFLRLEKWETSHEKENKSI
jgi:hypothetical protein